MTTTYALHDAVEAFPAGDGAIYFLRGGTHAEHVLEAPTEVDRRALELLHAPRTRGELLAAAGGATGTELDELLGALDDLGLLATSDAATPPDLPAEAMERYDRQLPYVGVEGQRRLLASTVAIVGCGALGSWTAAGLVSAGVGRLVLVDDDTVELSNLNRQVLFRRDDVGRRKVDAAADALLGFDPWLEVTRVGRRVGGPADAEAVTAGADIIVATADDPPYVLDRWLNAVAVARGVPLISASQLPPAVRVGPLVVPGTTGCLECQDRAARREHPEFDALVRYRETHQRTAVAFGPLCALVGSILSTDVVHLVTGVAAPATQGHAIVVDGRDLSVVREPVERDPGCPCCAATHTV